MTVIRAILVGTLTVSGIALLVWQHRVSGRLRAENAALRNQMNEIAELNRLREANRRMAERQVDVEALDKLRSNQIELLRLRGELGVLRRQLAERIETSPPTGADTNQPGERWMPGGLLLREQWQDAGQASAKAALQTYLWAVSHSDGERLGQCVRFPAGPGATNLVEREIASWQADREDVIGARLVSVTYSDGSSLVYPKEGSGGSGVDRAEIFAEILDPPRAGEEQPDSQGQRALPQSKKFELVKVDSQWIVYRNMPPEVTVLRLSADSAERARQLETFPPEMREVLKSLPPGKRIVVRKGAW